MAEYLEEAGDNPAIEEIVSMFMSDEHPHLKSSDARSGKLVHALLAYRGKEGKLLEKLKMQEQIAEGLKLQREQQGDTAGEGRSEVPIFCAIFLKSPKISP